MVSVKMFRWIVIPACSSVLVIYLAGVGLLTYGLTPDSSCPLPIHAYEAVWPLWAIEKVKHVSDESLIGRARLAVLDWSLSQCDKEGK